MRGNRVYVRTQKSNSYRHPVNEDSYMFSEYAFMQDEKIRVLVIADGMGGLSDGEKASHNAVLGFCKAFYASMAETYMKVSMELFSMSYFADKMEGIVKEAIREANSAVCRNTAPYIASGTTLSVVCLVGGYGIVANVGDSPVFFYRAKTRELKLVSKLQTIAEMEVAAGKYERYSQEYYANDHYLYNSLGEHLTLDDMDIACNQIGKLSEGDVFLIGSDGAFGRLEEYELLELLESCEVEDESFFLSQLFELARADKDDDQTAILYVVCEEETNGEY